jgi:DNA polymerase-3 subunit epsilon
MLRAVIVDLETTGLKPSEDTIIEVGLIELLVSSDHKPVIRGMFSALQDPGFPLSPEISGITGLTDDALSGESIDWDIVKGYLNRADVIIAHNAEFDRGFLSAVPALREIRRPWACSVRHIDWREKKFASSKLQYLAADHGFVNPFAHRALFDCATTFRLVSPHLQEMLQNSREAEFEVFAVGSPFESKDVLKAAGYRWDSDRRVWRKRVMSHRIENERDFLARDVYKGPSRHVEEEYYFNPRV